MYCRHLIYFTNQFILQVPGVLEANPLPSLREFTLRMDSDHYVEVLYCITKYCTVFYESFCSVLH